MPKLPRTTEIIAGGGALVPLGFRRFSIWGVQTLKQRARSWRRWLRAILDTLQSECAGCWGCQNAGYSSPAACIGAPSTVSVPRTLGTAGTEGIVLLDWR